MTLLAAWLGVDMKKNGPQPCSIYFASDSRISWNTDYGFNMAQKVFYSKSHPDIYGFCGDVVFAVNFIGQLVGHADNNLLFPENCEADQKFSEILNKLSKAIEDYPTKFSTGSFKVLFATRDFYKKFHVYQLSWDKEKGLSTIKFDLPNHSGLLTAVGSGAVEFYERYNFFYDVSKHNNFRTSRTVYHCFTETLKNIKDHASGGVPQIVGLYRVGCGVPFGIIDNDIKYFMGQKVEYNGENLNFVEWRNHLFERYDPIKVNIKDAAQRQPKS